MKTYAKPTVDEHGFGSVPRTYVAPELREYGDIRQLTLAGGDGLPDDDFDQGTTPIGG
ncbi:MAG: lasso RiPP family leader peptide-containing protein [Armatimonadota bacterium]